MNEMQRDFRDSFSICSVCMSSMNYGLGWVVGAHVRDLISSWIKRILGLKLNFETGVKCLGGHYFFSLVDKMFN